MWLTVRHISGIAKQRFDRSVRFIDRFVMAHALHPMTRIRFGVCSKIVLTLFRTLQGVCHGIAFDHRARQLSLTCCLNERSARRISAK
jgi:hypothetical protein